MTPEAFGYLLGSLSFPVAGLVLLTIGLVQRSKSKPQRYQSYPGQPGAYPSQPSYGYAPPPVDYTAQPVDSVSRPQYALTDAYEPYPQSPAGYPAPPPYPPVYPPKRKGTGLIVAGIVLLVLTVMSAAGRNASNVRSAGEPHVAQCVSAAGCDITHPVTARTR